MVWSPLQYQIFVEQKAVFWMLCQKSQYLWKIACSYAKAWISICCLLRIKILRVAWYDNKSRWWKRSQYREMRHRKAQHNLNFQITVDVSLIKRCAAVRSVIWFKFLDWSGSKRALWTRVVIEWSEIWATRFRITHFPGHTTLIFIIKGMIVEGIWK